VDIYGNVEKGAVQVTPSDMPIYILKDEERIMVLRNKLQNLEELREKLASSTWKEWRFSSGSTRGEVDMQLS